MTGAGRRAVTVLATALLGLASVQAVSAGSAAARPVRGDATAGFSIVYGSLKVTSSTHKHLTLVVFAAREEKSAAVGLSAQTRSGSEQHEYLLSDSSATDTISRGSGHLSLPASAGHGYLALSLTAKRTSQHTQSCSKQNFTRHGAVRLTGTMRLVTKSTGSHRWGTLGSKHTKVTFTGQWYEEYGSGTADCSADDHQACAASISWDANDDANGDYTGYSPTKQTTLSVSRSTPLGSYGFRFDEVLVKAKKVQLSGSGASAVLTVHTGHSPAHGTLTLAATAAPSTSTETCYRGKKKSSQTEYDWDEATVTAHDFSVTEQIFGTFHAPTGDASFTQLLA